MEKRINLGCGRDVKEGWINLDSFKLPGVDIVFDLEECGSKKIPLDDNSIDEFFASHLLEHIKNVLPFLQELYRIAKPNAKITFRCPYGSSDDAFEDPTHVRQMFINSFGFFSQPYYWRADYGYKGDWKLDKVTFNVDKSKGIGKDARAVLNDISIYRNIVQEIIAEMSAVKPMREPLKELRDKPKIVINLV